MQNHSRLADLDRLPHCTNEAHAVVFDFYAQAPLVALLVCVCLFVILANFTKIRHFLLLLYHIFDIVNRKSAYGCNEFDIYDIMDAGLGDFL